MIGSLALTDSTLQDILCCMGHPMAGNPMQFMMEKTLASLGLDWRFLTLDVELDDLEAAVRGMKAMGFVGGTLFCPHQDQALLFMDSLSETANRVQGVNCVHLLDGQLRGEMTTGGALVESLPTDFEIADKSVAVVGSDATARAVVLALMDQPLKSLQWISPKSDARELFVAGFNLDSTDSPEAGEEQQPQKLQVRDTIAELIDPNEVDLWISTAERCDDESSDSSWLSSVELRAESMVIDLVSMSDDSPLLEQAREQGGIAINGLEVFVRQASRSLAIWTGREASIDIMIEAVEEYLEI